MPDSAPPYEPVAKGPHAHCEVAHCTHWAQVDSTRCHEHQPPYRLVVTLEFDTDEDRQDWLREHEDGRCSDLYPWSTVRMVTPPAERGQ